MKTLISALFLASASVTTAYALVPVAQPSIVEMQTSIGTVMIQLNWEKAPISSQNFINYVINQKDLFQNIKRIDFIAKAEDFSYINNQSAIIKKILHDLNITDKTNYILSETSSNIITENIFSKLSKIQIDKLYDYQNLDSEIYFSNIYTKY